MSDNDDSSRPFVWGLLGLTCHANVRFVSFSPLIEKYTMRDLCEILKVTQLAKLLAIVMVPVLMFLLQRSAR